MSGTYADTGTDGRVRLSCVRGDSFGFMIRCWQDVEKTVASDFSGATVRAQVRCHPDDTEVVAEFHVTVNGEGGNELSLVLLPVETAVLLPTNVWDVQVDWDSSGTSIQTIVSGTLAVGADVTRV